MATEIFRPLGMQMGRTVPAVGDSPWNLLGSSLDARQQPGGTRWIALGEDLLSPSVNRGFMALALDVDSLNQLGHRIVASQKVVKVAKPGGGWGSSIAFGLLGAGSDDMLHVPLWVGLAADPAAATFFKVLDSNGRILCTDPVAYNVTPQPVTYTVETLNGDDPQANPEITAAMTVIEAGRYYLKIAGLWEDILPVGTANIAYKGVVRPGLVARVAGFVDANEEGVSYNGDYEIIKVDGQYLWLGSKLASGADMPYFAPAELDEKAGLRDDVEDKSPFTLHYEETALPLVPPTVTVVGKGFYPNLVMTFNETLPAEDFIYIVCGIGQQVGIPDSFSPAEAANRSTDTTVASLSQMTLDQAYRGLPTYGSAPQAQGRVIGSDAGPVVVCMDSRDPGSPYNENAGFVSVDNDPGFYGNRGYVHRRFVGHIEGKYYQNYGGTEGPCIEVSAGDINVDPMVDPGTQMWPNLWVGQANTDHPCSYVRATFAAGDTNLWDDVWLTVQDYVGEFGGKFVYKVTLYSGSAPHHADYGRPDLFTDAYTFGPGTPWAVYDSVVTAGTSEQIVDGGFASPILALNAPNDDVWRGTSNHKLLSISSAYLADTAIDVRYTEFGHTTNPVGFLLKGDYSHVYLRKEFELTGVGTVDTIGGGATVEVDIGDDLSDLQAGDYFELIGTTSNDGLYRVYSVVEDPGVKWTVTLRTLAGAAPVFIGSTNDNYSAYRDVIRLDVQDSSNVQSGMLSLTSHGALLGRFTEGVEIGVDGGSGWDLWAGSSFVNKYSRLALDTTGASALYGKLTSALLTETTTRGDTAWVEVAPYTVNVRTLTTPSGNGVVNIFARCHVDQNPPSGAVYVEAAHLIDMRVPFLAEAKTFLTMEVSNLGITREVVLSSGGTLDLYAGGVLTLEGVTRVVTDTPLTQLGGMVNMTEQSRVRLVQPHDSTSGLAYLQSADGWKNIWFGATSHDPSGGLPGAPSGGDTYLATATANGWTSGHIYRYNGATTAWVDISSDYATWKTTIKLSDTGMHSMESASNWNVTVPAGEGGDYLVVAHAAEFVFSGTWLVGISIDGADPSVLRSVAFDGDGTDRVGGTVSAVVGLTAGQTVSLMVHNLDGIKHIITDAALEVTRLYETHSVVSY